MNRTATHPFRTSSLVLVTALAILLSLLAGCGSGSTPGSTVSLSDSPVAGTDPRIAELNSNSNLSSADATLPDGLTSNGSVAEEPLRLAVSERVKRSFDGVVQYEQGQKRSPGIRYVLDKRELIINYLPGCSVDQLNANRSKPGGSEDPAAGDPIRCSSDARYLDTEPINNYLSESSNPYAVLSLHLAHKYLLDVLDESYCEGFNTVLMRTKGAAVTGDCAAEIQRENADFIGFIRPNYLMKSTAYEIRDEDPLVDLGQEDNYGPFVFYAGVGLDRETNGPMYWDRHSGEWYQVFQVNAHPLHWGGYEVAPGIEGRGFGDGVQLFVLDSGCIPDHEDLPANDTTMKPVYYGLTYYGDEEVWDGNPETYWDASGADPPSTLLLDLDDHGTMITSVIAARGNNGLGGAGILPYAQVLPIRIGERNVTTETWYFERGLKRATLIAEANGGPYVMSLSYEIDPVVVMELPLGQNPYYDLVLWFQDYHPQFTVACAAGNDKSRVIASTGTWQGHPYIEGYVPQCLAFYSKNFICVAGVSVSKDDTNPENQYEHRCGCTNYPSIGITLDIEPKEDPQEPDVHRHCSIAATGYGQGLINKDGDYTTLQGTSFASPQVAAAVAQLRAYDPDLTPEEVWDHVNKTARWHKWDGSERLDVFDPVDYNEIVKILDVGNMLSWVAITGPEDNVGVVEPIMIELEYHLAGGELHDDENVSAKIQVFIQQDGMSLPIQVGENLDLNGPAGPLGVEFDPDLPRFADLNDGPAEIYAKLVIPAYGERPDRPPFYTQRLPVYLDSSFDHQYLEVSHDCTDPEHLNCVLQLSHFAIGLDRDDRLYAAWSRFHTYQDEQEHEWTFNDACLAIEDDGGSSFTVYVVEEGHEYRNYDDLQICDRWVNGQYYTGVSYQRALHYPGTDPVDWEGCFAYYDPQLQQVMPAEYHRDPDPLDPTFLFGTPGSSWRSDIGADPEDPEDDSLRSLHVYDQGTDPIRVASPIDVGGQEVWTSTVLPIDPPDIGGVWSLSLFVDPAGLRTTIGSMNLRTYYGVIDLGVPSIYLTELSSEADGEWIGTALWPKDPVTRSDIDPSFDPWIFTKAQDASGYYVAVSYPVAGEEAALSGTAIIESSSSAFHGQWGDATYARVLDMPIVCFNSGNYGSPDHANTLKLAYLVGLVGNAWRIVLLDDMNISSSAIGSRADAIYVLHAHTNGFLGPNSVWLEIVRPGL